MKRLLLLLLAAILLAACRGEAPTASPQAAPAAELPPGVALVYRQEGGIKGGETQYTFYTDGRILSSNGERWELAPARITGLVVELEKAGFFKLTGDYMPEDTCCDRMTLVLIVRSGDRTHTVTTLEATREYPEALYDAIDAVNAFIAELS